MLTPGPIPSDQGGLSFIAPDPGLANDQTLATVPVGERWRVWAVAFTVTTDATSINRVIGLIVADETVSVIFVTSTSFMSPSETVRWHIVNNWPLGSGGIGINKVFPGAWPILLPAGGVISAKTQNWQFGDRITAIRILRERWIEPT